MVQLEEAIISSVVPMETKKLSRFIYTIYGIDPLILGPGIKTGLLLKVDNPNEVGSILLLLVLVHLNF